jgi:hypothetical protein
MSAKKNTSPRLDTAVEPLFARSLHTDETDISAVLP